MDKPYVGYRLCHSSSFYSCDGCHGTGNTSVNDVIHSLDCPHYPSEGNARAEFRKLLKTEIARSPELARELASHFQVADSTVVRWECGTAWPHPLTMQVIIDFIKQKTG